MKQILFLSILFFIALSIHEISIERIDPIEKLQEIQSTLKNQPPLTYLLKQFLPFFDSKSSIPELIMIHSQNYKFKRIFVGNVGIGTPTQHFNMEFDTTQTLSWVNSYKCSTSYCNNQNVFYNTKSSTFSQRLSSQKFNLLYARGPIAQDTFTIAGKSISHQTFGISLLSFFITDGAIGLGLPQENDTSNQLKSPLFTTGFKQGAFQDNSFSMYLSQDDGKQGSSLVLGGINSKYAKGDFNYFPISIKNQWVLDFKNMQIEDLTLNIGNATIDSAYASFIISTEQYDQICDKLQIQPKSQFRCKDTQKFPTLKFQIQDQMYSLESQYYTQKIETGLCQLLFQPNDFMENDDIAIGTPFFLKYYTHFDLGNKQIGFAEAQQ